MHNPHVRQRGALTVTGLQHPQLLALDGELKVLHIAEALLQRLADLLQLRKALGENLVLGHQRNRQRRAHASNNIFALRIDQVLAVEDVLAVGWVARKRNAGGAIVAHVSVDHRLHVDSGAPLMRNLVLVAINSGAIVIPAAKHSGNGAFQLRHRIIGEALVCPALHQVLVALHQLLEILLSEQRVFHHSALALHSVHDFLKRIMVHLALLLHAHHHVAVHLYEAAVAIPCKAAVTGGLLQGFDSDVVEAEIQNGVHHARHRIARAGAHRNQQRIATVAKLLLDFLLNDAQAVLHLLGKLLREAAAVVVVPVAHFGADGESGRNWEAHERHGGEVGTLAAEQCLLRTVAIGALSKGINHLLGSRRSLRLGVRCLRTVLLAVLAHRCIAAIGSRLAINATG